MTDAGSYRESARAHEVVTFGALTVTSEREGAVHTICLSGELDLATADVVNDELMRAEGDDASSIVLDLSGLTFIDSTGLRLLVTAAARSRADSDRLALLRGGPAVQRAFALTGLEAHLPFAD
ncbi:MAG TPA: STAS domain-containing protein [Solirubrobacteraceae bacterium]|nr:STAS domain-containing protein [Solirubrobacteraceae bacterium]